MATVEQSLSQLVDAVSVHDGEPQTRSVQVHDALSSERIQADHSLRGPLCALHVQPVPGQVLEFRAFGVTFTLLLGRCDPLWNVYSANAPPRYRRKELTNMWSTLCKAYERGLSWDVRSDLCCWFRV